MENEYEKPSEEMNIYKEELNKARIRYVNQISNIETTFSSALDNIKEDFKNKYNLYIENLKQNLREYDDLIENHFKFIDIKNQCHSEINNLLKQKLQEKTNYYKTYIEQVQILTKNILNTFFNDDDFKIKINEKLKEKEKEEIIKKKESKTKLEINGENILDKNIKDLVDAINKNYVKIILRKMPKERLDQLFSPSHSIYSSFLNNKDVNNIERAASYVTVSGEAAPGIGVSLNQENENINKNCKFLTDISIVDSANLENINFATYFPYIEDLKIYNCKVSYNIAEKLNFTKLSSLKLEGIGLINENFNALFEQLRNNEEMRKNLRILSVKKNNISFLDYKKGYADNKLREMTFDNLEILNMSYNKIYFFQNHIFNSLNNIKLIDLTNNNMDFPTASEIIFKTAKSKKCLVLMTNNLAILKEKANKEYIKYVIQILKEIDYPFNNITLDNIFCCENNKKIFEIELGKFRDSLEYLELSNNQLKDNDLIYLLNEKWNLPNLKYLILESNHLTEKFLYSLLNKDEMLAEKFSKLKILNLSDNQINCSDLDKFKQSLELFKNLEILELKHTPIEKCINQILRKKVIQMHDQNKQNKQKPGDYAFTEEENALFQIIGNNYLEEKTKITISIMDQINTKYTKFIATHLPKLLERITMENKFPL